MLWSSGYDYWPWRPGQAQAINAAVEYEPYFSCGRPPTGGADIVFTSSQYRDPFRGLANNIQGETHDEDSKKTVTPRWDGAEDQKSVFPDTKQKYRDPFRSPLAVAASAGLDQPPQPTDNHNPPSHTIIDEPDMQRDQPEQWHLTAVYKENNVLKAEIICAGTVYQLAAGEMLGTWQVVQIDFVNYRVILNQGHVNHVLYAHQSIK